MSEKSARSILCVMFRTMLECAVAMTLLAGCDSSEKESAGESSATRPAGAESLAAPGQTLPEVPFALPGFDTVNKVYLTKTGIQLNERTLVTIENGKIDPAALHGHLIGPLFDSLTVEVEKGEAVAAKIGAARDSNLVVLADATTPFTTLVDVLYTAGTSLQSRRRNTRTPSRQRALSAGHSPRPRRYPSLPRISHFISLN